MPATIPVSENPSQADLRIHCPSSKSVAIRDYPYPFVAAFSLANGVDGMSFEIFSDIFQFVCGSGTTPYGDGLGLDVGFSFTLAGGASRASFGRCSAGTGDENRDDEAKVIELAAAGWIDTLRNVEACDDHRRSLDRLAASGVSPPVGVDTDKDLPGMRFRSDDRLVERYKFGDHANLGGSERIREGLKNYRWEQWADIGRLATSDALFARFNAVLQGSGSTDAHPFKRYAGPLRPTGSTFASQVTSADLDKLEKDRAVVVVEQQLGLTSIIGASEKSAAVREAGLPALDFHGVIAWRDLAQRAGEGRILVTTLARLLRWLELRDALAYRVTQEPARWTILIEGYRSARGKIELLAASDLDGLAFTVPSEAPEVIVRIEGGSAPLEMVRAVDPGRPDLNVIHAPWRKLSRQVAGV